MCLLSREKRFASNFVFDELSVNLSNELFIFGAFCYCSSSTKLVVATVHTNCMTLFRDTLKKQTINEASTQVTMGSGCTWEINQSDGLLWS